MLSQSCLGPVFLSLPVICPSGSCYASPEYNRDNCPLPCTVPVRPPGGTSWSQLFLLTPLWTSLTPAPPVSHLGLKSLSLLSGLGLPAHASSPPHHRVFFSQRPGYSSALSSCAASAGLALVQFWTPRLRCSLGLWTPSEHLAGILALQARVWNTGQRVLSCSGQEGGASARQIPAPPTSHPLTCFFLWRTMRIKRAHWL